MVTEKPGGCPDSIRYLNQNEANGCNLMIFIDLLFLFDAAVFCPQSFSYPLWTKTMNDGKAAYVFARNKEIKRKGLLESELIRFEWDLYYKVAVDSIPACNLSCTSCHRRKLFTPMQCLCASNGYCL